MRLIDADAFKNTLSELTVEGKSTKEVEGGIKVLRIMPQVVDDEPTIEAEPVNRWVSINDRLPPKGRDVLVCDFDDYAGVGFFDGAKWNIDGFEMSTPPVSHWQPLPKPPEKSKKEA